MRTRKFTWSALVLTLGMFAVLLAGCGGNSSNAGQKAPDDKQILKTALVPNKIDIRRLDPARITDLYSFTAAVLIYPGLVTLDSKLNIIPWAAESMPTVTDNGTTYTFKIRSGLKWTDGTPIDANTFAYAMNRSLDPCTLAGGASYLYPIKGAADFNSAKCPTTQANKDNPVSATTLIGKSIVVSDPQTLVITLEKPYAFFLGTLTTAVALAQPKQLIEKYGMKPWQEHLADNGGFGGNMFNVKLWDHQGKLNLVRNEGFWGTKPTLKEIDFKIYKDADTAFNDYKAGQVDRAAPPSAQYVAAKARPDFHETPFLATAYIQPNWKKAPFDDVNARQAFALAIDKDSIANKVLKGADIPTNHIVPQGELGYFPDLKGPDGTTNLKGNAAKAKELITAYAAAKCGGEIAKCKPVDYYTSDTPDNVAMTQAILAQWQAAMPGYPINVHNIAFNDLLDKAYSGDAPQLVGIAWIVDYPDPQDWLSLQFLPNSSSNTGNVNDPVATDLMNKGDIEQNAATRLQLTNQAEQELVNQGAWIPLFQQKGPWVVSKHVVNFDESTAGYPTLDIWTKVYITQ